MTNIHDALDKAIQHAELEQNQTTLKNFYQDQIIPNIGIPCALNPEILKQRRIVSLQDDSPESEAFKMLRTKVFKLLRDNDWTSFAITAPTPGVGKTTVAVNLAIAMALDLNQSILLVDLDLKSPKVHWSLGLENESGLGDYFLFDKPLADILINPGIERLTILPGKGRINGSSEFLSSPRMKSLLNDIGGRNQSRIVIFDLPPVLATDDVLATTEYYDAVLLVVEEGRTTPEELNKTLKLLSGIKLLGTVLNKSQNPPEHFSY